MAGLYKLAIFFEHRRLFRISWFVSYYIDQLSKMKKRLSQFFKTASFSYFVINNN